ncbi:major capsid protein [Clostridium sporogenes]|uniref:major capsid protein n=1 Tax=Clostridium sporogenes TaxID=1509 RepID=UPI0013D4FF68|nr:major capsid protein [Clostridium sporogenes]MCW6124230.1 major capsid protein [Clostridium sporogenes]NFH40120.1 coat protein [Clostridium sporogenes]NFQ67378.1 coat protein [Clostridium sporogenes]
MSTKISDIIVPEVFNPYVVQETNRLDAFVQSGIIASDSELDVLATSGGVIVNMPYWNDLEGDSEELSDNGSLTVNKITAGQDRARLHMRGKAWGVNDLAKALSGDDPMAVIGQKVAKFWVGERSKILFKSLAGIETTAASNVHDISTSTGADALISVGTTLDAKQKLGDNASKLTGIAMHSAVYTKLQKNNEIEFVPDSETKINIPYYLGQYRVIVDDQCPNNAGTYTTYLFGQGAFGLGNGAAPVPTETDRDSLAGEDVLINRQHFLLHPRGIKWTETTVTGKTPTFAEIATVDNWSKVYDTKNIRIVIFKHKIA